MKQTTLKLNREFRRLYFKGKSLVHPLVVTYAMPNRTGANRIGITATKKIGNAVHRNRARRIIRAAYLELAKEVPQGWDFVFVARSKTPDAKSTQILPVLKKHIETLTKRKAKNSV